MKKPKLVCFGMGYTAQHLARRLLAEGWQVVGSCRSEEKADVLRGAGIIPVLFSPDQPLADSAAVMADATHLLSSIPPDKKGDPVLAAHSSELASCGQTLSWIGYLSTVGVYGDQQGKWVDEQTPVNPGTGGTRRRVQAERDWLALGGHIDVPAHVFRLPGIYGPGSRNQLAALRSGRARRLIKPGQVFNRIHVEDLVSVVCASMAQPGGSAFFNIADDEPAAADEVVCFAAALLSMQPPPEEQWEDAEMSELGRRFYSECKRVRNDRIKQELGIELRFSTYREGLKAIAAQMQSE
jgi:nucleoside-diphosphate-sugar epimerase